MCPPWPLLMTPPSYHCPLALFPLLVCPEPLLKQERSPVVERKITELVQVQPTPFSFTSTSTSSPPSSHPPPLVHLLHVALAPPSPQLHSLMPSSIFLSFTAAPISISLSFPSLFPSSPCMAWHRENRRADDVAAWHGFSKHHSMASTPPWMASAI